MFIHRIRRGNRIIEAEPGTSLEMGDVLALSGPRQAVVERIGPRAEELEDRELLDVPVRAADVILLNPKLAGTTLGEASRQGWTRGFYLRSISRGGQEIPAWGRARRAPRRRTPYCWPGRRRAEGGSQDRHHRRSCHPDRFCRAWAGDFLRRPRWRSPGLPRRQYENLLSTSVGALLAGLAVGALRTRHPLFGRIPDGAVSLMTSLGLAAFVGLTGINAGPVFIAAVKEAGIGLLLGGMVVTILPQVVGLIFGHFALRMNPILLLGAWPAGTRSQPQWLRSRSDPGVRSLCWVIRRPIRSPTS